MNDQESSLRTLFIEALELPDTAGRAGFLERVCGGDAQLRHKLERLLRAHDDVGEAAWPDGAAEATPRATERVGDRIGRYRLHEQIGEGGCGVVYVAEQEEPVRRRVALKVIKLGMDTRQVIARFEAERQALAMMDHPNIAKVLDAGATDTGRPYFVMELVRGTRITDYCDRNTIPTRQRLDLFVQVCRAIQHAHQKGVIHRDIKPSNILVTLHDGVPVPKVIDFGIAKATEGRLAEMTVYTGLQQFVGTPAYMSPEQAEVSGLDIDTRSDIYSLGVLLYELLTGRTPFDADTLLRAGLDKMRRIIREQAPVKPSARLGTLADADLAKVAQHRQAEAPRLVHLVRGDLDWIVIKALEKDRTRRYETANGLAVDIERHLNNEPVVARPPGNLYRLQKLVRRNKLAVAATAAVAVSLLAGTGFSTWSLHRERAALKVAGENALRAEQQAGLAERARTQAEANERRAEEEAATSQQVARFMHNMLAGVGPSVALGRDTTMLREILDQTAERVGRDLENQPLVEAELRATIGGVYYALGAYEQAAAMHREALALRRDQLGDTHTAVAASLNQLANVPGEQGQLAEAEAMHKEALALRIDLRGDLHAEVAGSLNDLALVLRQRGKLAEAESTHRQALAMQRQLLGDGHPDVAVSLHNLGSVLQEQGKLDEAATLHREALDIHRNHLGGEHPDVAAGLGNVANVLHRQGKLAESEAKRREALAMWRKLVGNDHPDTATCLYNLASLLRLEGRLEEAEAMHREVLAIRRKVFGDEHSSIADVLDDLANVLLNLDRPDEAEAMARESLAMRRKLLGDGHPDVATGIGNLAIVLRRQGKLAESEAMQREGLALMTKLLGPDHPNVASSLNNLTNVLGDLGKRAEAEAVGREALAITRRALGDRHPDVDISIDNLATTLYDQGKLAELEELFREAVALARDWAPGDPAGWESRVVGLAEALYFQERYAEAEPLYREVLQSQLSRLEPGDDAAVSTAAGLARVLSDWAFTQCSPSEGGGAPDPEAAGRAREAERLLRDCLAACALRPETGLPAEFESLLGSALVAVAVADPALDRQARLAILAETDPLLLGGYRGVQRIEDLHGRSLQDAITRLVRLHEAWEGLEPGTGHAAQAAEWREKLGEAGTGQLGQGGTDVPEEPAD
jgi:serine/threonine protein kinase/tetratricopeptide (TPR) repeat protein